MIVINNLKFVADKIIQHADIVNKITKKYKIKAKEINKFEILKKSIDARNKNNVLVILTIGVVFKSSDYEKLLLSTYKDLKVYDNYKLNIRKVNNPKRILVVGSGPAGLFNALVLSTAGHKVTIIERGSEVDSRKLAIKKHIETKELDINTNIQFGEGGAGTFSDGKLNTGSNSEYKKYVLEQFVNFGAPSNILYDAKPHIGTDYLVDVVKNMRKYLISNGVEYKFNTILTNITEDKIFINDEDVTKSYDQVVLAIGHSAKDTYKMLIKNNFNLQFKNFAVGVRIEHLQSMIQESQYAGFAPYLDPADYKGIVHLENGRTVYTFCMCPGGQVVNATSDQGMIVTNGMSNSSRDSENANSAILVNINSSMFDQNDILAPIKFQESLEKKAYDIANGCMPVQRFIDFKNKVVTKEFKTVMPSVLYEHKCVDLNQILPNDICECLIEGITKIGKSIKGFDIDDAVLTGVETRTSAPYQITREEFKIKPHIYAIGEGAGYGGGIMSCAIDGIKCALKIIEGDENDA